MKKWLAFVCLPVAGIVAAAAVAAGTATTGTVSVCATAVASTPAHTVGVDGSGVDTIPGDSQTNSNCATTTYTVPTVTETDTVTTTVGTTTTPAPPAADYYLSDSGSGQPQLVSSAPTQATDSITVAAGASSYTMTDGRHAAYIVTPGVTGPQHGTYTATVHVTSTFAGAKLRVALEQNGAFIGGGWTAYQDASAAGDLTFTVDDTASPDWTSTASLQLFVSAMDSNASGSGTVSWQTGGVSTLDVPFSASQQAPSGSVLFDGRASGMTDLQSHEVCQTCGYNTGPITWPDGSVHYFYRNQTPSIWSCVCFIKDDLSLVSDPVFGKALDVNVATGDTNPWHANKGGTVNGAGQVSIEQPNHLGEWQYYGIAAKVPAWNGPISDLYFVDIASLGYQTSSNDQLGFGLWNGPDNAGPLMFDLRVNGGAGSGPLGNTAGTTHFQTELKPVTFGQWDEFVFAVKWSTTDDGEVKVYNRHPGGAWSVVFDKAGISDYLYGDITEPNGTVRHFSQDGHDWSQIINKIGLYFSEYGQESEHVQESGLTISDTLAAAEATLP